MQHLSFGLLLRIGFTCRNAAVHVHIRRVPAEGGLTLSGLTYACDSQHGLHANMPMCRCYSVQHRVYGYARSELTSWDSIHTITAHYTEQQNEGECWPPRDTPQTL